MPEDETDTRPALFAAGITKKYKNGTEAVRGIDLKVSPGESLSILGPNGAGKTTFLRVLTTELLPTEGEVRVFGIDSIKNPTAAKSMIGVTPQDAGVFETLRVREHLELFARIKGLTRQTARRQTDELLVDLDLKISEHKRVGELSGGQRRRLLIALALIGKPPMLILDEPTTGLDPVSRRAVWKLLKRVAATGTTVIFSTHYMEEAEELSERIAFVNAGKIVALGTLDELRQLFPHRYRLRFTRREDRGSYVTVFFETFGEVEDYVRSNEPHEYQISTSSLEDVYFSIAGEYLDSEGDPEGGQVGL